MIYNRLYKTRPVVVHAPGPLSNKPLWPALEKAAGTYRRPPCSQDGLEILTWNSGANAATHEKPLGLFESSVAACGLRCAVLGSGIGSRWNNRMKISLTIEHLRSVSVPYVMGVDSCDALLVGDPMLAVKFLGRHGCRMAFNAEQQFWPKTGLDHIKEFEESLSSEPFRFLNAGAWVAETAFAMTFFTKVLEESGVTEDWQFSEQVCVKKTYPALHPNVIIDSGCEVFQVLDKWTTSDMVLIGSHGMVV